MPFSESTKKEARERAHFRCCLCEEIKPLDVHHIILESQGGSDEFDNAVALCPNCHTEHGGEHMDNRIRSWIRQKRDWWYGHCEKLYEDNKKLKEIYNVVVDLKTSNETKINELLTIIVDLSNQISSSGFGTRPLTPGEMISALNEFRNASGTLAVASAVLTQQYDIENTTVECSKCKTKILVLGFQDKYVCPNCHTVFHTVKLPEGMQMSDILKPPQSKSYTEQTSQLQK